MSSTTTKRSILLSIALIMSIILMGYAQNTKAASQITIKYMLGKGGDPKPNEARVAKFMTANPDIKVDIVYGSESATELLSSYQQVLAAKSSDIDVFQFDTIWPGILADNLIDLTPAIKAAKVDTSAFYPALYNNDNVGGKQVGIPFFTDAGLLYYRTDLLKKYGFDKPPATWDELEKMAKKIQDGERATNKDFWGFVWQGNSYEGLTCDALEWQYTNGGGLIVETDGTISINNPKAIAAIDRAAKWVGTISPDGVTKYQEEDSRAVWQAGNAAFMRNWPYAYLLGNGGADGKQDTKIKGLFDVEALPSGDAGHSAAALGGWQLGVSAYSKNADAAAKFVLFMTSAEIQKDAALTSSLLPTIKSLYSDKDIAKQIPFIANLVPVFTSASPRPSTVTAAKYNDVSTAYFTAVHDVLTKKSDAKTAFGDLEVSLKQLLGEKFKVGPVPTK